MDDLQDPMVPAGCDLMDFKFTPIYRARLFSSSFHARANDAEWRAGVTLWLKSWDQVPAGSLPDDDIELCRLAELGRDIKTWKKVRRGALHGWVKCSDGLLYHPVVAEGVIEAWNGKLRQRWRTECARVKKQNDRAGEKQPLPTFEEWMSQGTRTDVTGDINKMSQGTENNVHALSPGTSKIVPRDITQCHSEQTSMSLGTKADVPREITSKRKGKGKGEYIADADARASDEISPEMQDQLFEAAGNSLNLPASPDLLVMGRPMHWLKIGADWDLDILPTVRIQASKGRPHTIRSWNYFDGPIADAMARRNREMPKGNANERKSGARQTQGSRLDNTFAGIFRAGGEGGQI